MYKFPIINCLDDVRHAISDDFFTADRDWGTVINYHIQAFPEIKDDMADEEKQLEYIRREFRGIKFGLDGSILGRPFQKFFNWGEKEAEMAHFDFDQPFVIMDKLDGSMLHPVLMPDGSEDDIVWMTKMGSTEVADQGRDYIKKCNDKVFSSDYDLDVDPNYDQLVNEWLHSGWTLIFEWCSRKNRIVVDYPEDQMILTAIRNIQTGEYLSYNKMKETADSFNIPVAKAWKGNFSGIDQFVEEIGGEENCEGYIIRFDNGHMVKLKNAWYLNLHRAKSELESEKNVWKLVLSQHHDDLIPQLDPDTQKALKAFADELGTKVVTEARKYESEVREMDALYGNRRDFAINYAQKTNWPSVAFKILDGNDAFDVVVDHIIDQTNKAPKLDSIKKYFGIDWKSYYHNRSE